MEDRMAQLQRDPEITTGIAGSRFTGGSHSDRTSAQHKQKAVSTGAF